MIDLFAKGRKEHNRTIGQGLLGLGCELPYFVSSGAIDEDDEVKRLVLRFRILDDRVCLGGCLGARDSGRVTKVELQILLRYLHVDTTILLECKTVIVIAHKENAPHAL